MPSGRHDRDQPAEPASGPGSGRRRAGRIAARVEGTGPGRQAVPVARCPRILAADPAYRPRQSRRARIGRPDLNRGRRPGGPPGHLARRLGRRRPAGRRHCHHPHPRRARSGWLRRAGRLDDRRAHRPAARAGGRLGRPQAGHPSCGLPTGGTARSRAWPPTRAATAGSGPSSTPAPTSGPHRGDAASTNSPQTNGSACGPGTACGSSTPAATAVTTLTPPTLPSGPGGRPSTSTPIASPPRPEPRSANSPRH